MKLKRKNACDVSLGFRWFPNGWKLERIESTPTNVSFEHLFSNKVEPIQEKQNQMYNLIPKASCHSDIRRTGLWVIGHLNINSIRNKFEMLSMSVAQYVDILVLSETKLDSTFPSIQFLINGFSVPHRLDRNSKGGGIWSYAREKVIVLPLNRYSLPPHIEILFFELNLRNQKWLVCCSYNPHKNIIKEHLQVFTESIQFY